MAVSAAPEVNFNERICDSDFTLNWIWESLVENDERFNEFQQNKVLKKIFAKDISGGKGMFSTVLKIELSFVDETSNGKNEEVYTTILKIPGTESFAAITEEGKDVEDHKFVSFCKLNFSLKHFCMDFNLCQKHIFYTCFDNKKSFSGWKSSHTIDNYNA